MNQLCQITYVCNAGILVQYKGKKILIDGLCNSIVPAFINPTDKTIKEIISGIPPFDNIDIMLFTHYHTDHFEAGNTAATIKNQPNITMVSTAKTVSMIKPLISSYGNNQTLVLSPTVHTSEYITINSIHIRAISLIHDGKDYRDVQNLAYLIEIEGKKILHVGDAKALDENFKDLDLIREDIDLLLAPFPYVGLPSGRKVIKNFIQPKKVGIIHLPYKDKDTDGWIDATKRSFERVKNDFVETIFFEELGASICI